MMKFKLFLIHLICISLIALPPAHAEDQLPEIDTSLAQTNEPDFKFLTFDFLTGFEYMPPQGYRTTDGRRNPDGPLSIWDRLPKSIMELGGCDVIISGYMIPIEYDNGGLKSFVLRRKPEDCCPDELLVPNQFILVESAGNSRLDYYMNIPVIVQGKFNIREVIEDDIVISLYHLKARKIFTDEN